jgi:hypothetical protein
MTVSTPKKGEMITMNYSENEMRKQGFVRYPELSEKGKKAAYERFAWDFVNEKPLEKSEDEILVMLSKHWFQNNDYAGTFLGRA